MRKVKFHSSALRIGDAATLKALTSSALDEMILMALEKDERGEILKDEHARMEGEYLRTLGTIRKRLEGEKASIAKNLKNDGDDTKNKENDANCGEGLRQIAAASGITHGSPPLE